MGRDCFLFEMYFWIIRIVFLVNCLPLSGDFKTSKQLVGGSFDGLYKKNHNKPGDMLKTFFQRKNQKAKWIVKTPAAFLENWFKRKLWNHRGTTSNFANEVRVEQLLYFKNSFGKYETNHLYYPERIETLHRERRDMENHVDTKTLMQTIPTLSSSVTETREEIVIKEKGQSSIPIIYRQYGSCEILHQLNSEKHLFLVNRCPNDMMFDLEILSYCQESVVGHHHGNHCKIDILHIPVQDNNGIVYRNIYCAICHKAHSISVWIAEVDVDDITKLEVKDGDAEIVFMNEINIKSKCTTSLIPSNPSAIQTCNAGDDFRGNSHTRVRDIPPGSEPQKSVFPLSFQIIMNFGINGKGHIFFSTTPQTDSVVVKKCQKNEVYDSNSKICKKITCAEGYRVIEYKCQPLSDTIIDESEAGPSYLNQQDETTQITLRLNVTVRDLLILQQANLQGSLVNELSRTLNVSSDRIRNLTLDIQNGTTSGKSIELHAYITAKPQENNRVAAKPIQAVVEDIPTIQATTEEAAGREEDEYIDNTQISPASSDEVYPEFYDSEPLPRTYTAILKFFILPTKRESVSDVSTKSAINTLKNPLDGKYFSFILNGTTFRVDNVTNNDEALVLDTWCTKGSMDFSTEFDLVTRYDPVTKRNVQGVFMNSTNTFYKQNMFDLYMLFTSTIGGEPNISFAKYVFVCNMPKLQDKQCGRIEVYKDDYKRFPNNSILYSGEMLEMNEYEYVNDLYNAIWACVPQAYKEYTSMALEEQSCGPQFGNAVIAESYLSFILGIASLLAMTSVVFTYSLFSTLRNLPGVNTMNLTLSLFLGELFFLLSAAAVRYEIVWLCEALGVILHYFFLASFFWMNVMSYDLFRTFANKCILTRVRDKKKYFHRYFLYAWGSPAIIVIVCAFIDFSNVFENLRIGYGGIADVYLNDEQIKLTTSNESETGNSTPTSFHDISPKQSLGCWIMEPVAALTTFGLPMIIILISNAFMFIKTIICIQATSKFVRSKTRRSSLSNTMGKSDVILYVRMSSVMGFTWLVGLASSIISAFTDTATDFVCVVLHTVGIIFVVLNCSQGLFIFFAFVFNRRVLGLYKEQIKAWKYKRENTNSFSSTSTLSSTLKQ